MKNNFENCLAVTLKWEGGYSNHPDDPGGPTMKGITQREFNSWLQHHGFKSRNVKTIADAELHTIYHDEYWVPAGCETLAAGLDLCVFDAAVNSGVSRAKQWLDLAGPDIDHFQDERSQYLHGLGRLWRVFGLGWKRRYDDITLNAHKMAVENANS